jgi:hypothetical protein
VEAQRATLASRRRTRSDEQRHRLLPVGQALTTVWDHPTASATRNKRLLRTVLHALLIETRQEPPEHRLQLHGHGGGHTEWRVARKTVGNHGRATAQQALAVIGALSKVCRAQTMAATLQRLGYRTGTGKPWRAHRVAGVRYQDRWPNCPQERAGLTLAHAAAQFGVSATVLRRLVAPGTLPASQVVPAAPWMIPASALTLGAVHTAGQAVQVSRRHPGRRPGQPAWPGLASPQAGEAQASVSPAETDSLQLRAGAP